MFMRTDRLYLRPAWPEDARAVFAGIGEWDIVRNLSRAPWPYLPEHAEEWVAREPEPGGASFLVRRRGDGALIGAAGFGRWRGPDQEPEIGYWIAREHWGRGYAAEAGRAVLELAFEAFRLPLLTAGHFVDNPASGAVLRKLGFSPTGEVFPYPCAARGTHVDTVDYLLTADHWRSARATLRTAA